MYLIDTHIFIWADEYSPNNPNQRLSPEIIDILQHADDVFISHVSFWEMQIKMMLGKLSLHNSLKQTIDNIKQTNAFSMLPINEQHILTIETLPPVHKDPFDRMLIAQAISEDLIIITDDEKFKNYPVRLLEN